MASAKAELHALRKTAELATKEHSVALAKVREEHLNEDEAWKATTSWGKVTLWKVGKLVSVAVSKLRSERESAAARHHNLLASIRLVFKAYDEQKDKAASDLMKLQKHLRRWT